MMIIDTVYTVCVCVCVGLQSIRRMMDENEWQSNCEEFNTACVLLKSAELHRTTEHRFTAVILNSSACQLLQTDAVWLHLHFWRRASAGSVSRAGGRTAQDTFYCPSSSSMGGSGAAAARDLNSWPSCSWTASLITGPAFSLRSNGTFIFWPPTSAWVVTGG